MKITPKILSIAPYLSTAWRNISTLNAREESGAFQLLVVLKDGHQVTVPNLDFKTVEIIFSAHALYSESQPEENETKIRVEEAPFNLALPFKIDENGGLDSLANMQHNPDQADFPPLPPGILKKISAIASAFGEEAIANLPRAKPNCNCIFCQLMNAIAGETEIEEEISEEDLKFRDWDVEQTADKLYVVKNPLDGNEFYRVFLGQPVGCTCGNKNCEHIRAVLST